jgi:peptide/nickel transport system substrate-binding protein
MELDEAGNAVTTMVPVLAESWEYVEPTRLRLKLRQGITFHNGEVFNAEAAKAAFDVLADAELAAKLQKFALLGVVESFEVVDEYTVDVVTPSPNTEVLNINLRLGFVAIPPKMLAEVGIEGFTEQPVGTGPYAFESWARGQDIVLTRNASYWDPNGPSMERVRFLSRPEAAVRAQTVAAGEADFAYNIGPEQAAALDYSVVGGGFQSTSIRLNNQIAPTNDIRVRKAINQAIDRDAIVDAVFRGSAQSAAFFAFQPVTLTPYAYDPETAIALIKEAGADGAELELIYGEGRIPEEDQLAEIYQASLEAIGLKIRLTKVEPQQYNEIGGRAFEEQPPLYMETTSSGNFGEVAGGLQDKYGCDGSGTYCDPSKDAEYVRLQSLEGEERLALLQSLAEQLHEEAPRAWVAAIQQVHGLSERVTTTLPLNAYIRFHDIAVK